MKNKIIFIFCFVVVLCGGLTVEAKVLSSVDKVLEQFFPGIQDITKEVKVLTDTQKSIIIQNARIKFDPVLDNKFDVFIACVDGKIIGYAIKDIVRGKWGLISYMVSMTPQGAVSKIVILEYKERRGRPVAKRRFLKQFKGKTAHDRILLKKDIQGVTGATISSKGMINGVRKIVHIFNVLYLDK